LLLVADAALASASEPRIHVMGIWPDRMRYFDEQTDEFFSEFRVRRGVVWHQDAALLPDYSRLYVITDRLETVEVIDLAKSVVVDEFKLSSDSRTVRLLRMAVDPSGKAMYVSARPVMRKPDRLIAEKQQIVVYDLEAHEVKASFEPPKGVDFGRLGVSPDGKWLLLFGRDIHLLDTTNYEVVDKIVFSEPVGAGYGALRVSLDESEPGQGIYHGVFRTTDPFLRNAMFGVARLDLSSRQTEIFELGPALRLGSFTLSPDEKRGYAIAQGTGASEELNDLVVVDMENMRVLARKEGFEQGRPNSSLTVSGDGTKLYVSGVGDRIHVYDTSTLELRKSIFAGGDVMLPALVFPRSVLAGSAPGSE
jgi:DNA-binding beta-propeller fold protein YncE